MRVVVIGDVSKSGNYHLGDEAMTEVAITQLKQRGADVTLVSGDPQLSAEHYATATVPRLGLRGVPRPKKLRLMKALENGLRGEGEVPESMRSAVDAVSSADAVVIAGGGNLNSSGEHHLFDRLALSRIAAFHEVPLYVSSQSVGPHLSTQDREIVKEIADRAVVFGVRERTSAQLMRTLVARPEAVVLTYDDAVLIPQTDSTVPEVDVSLPSRFVIGSFTVHPGATLMRPQEYYRTIATALDHIVASCDVDIVLAPHTGALGARDRQDQDCQGHAHISNLMTSSRVHELPVLSAAQVARVTSAAEFTVSTRYHPLVFGPAVGVPAIGLVTSHYSMIRMRGALEHFGMSTFAVPFEGWNGVFGQKLVDELMDDRAQLSAHLKEAGQAAGRHQVQWWDGIVASIHGTGDVMTEDVPITTQPYRWGTAQDQEALAVFTGVHDALNRTRQNLTLEVKERRRDHKAMAQTVLQLSRKGEQLEDRCDRLQRELEKSKKDASSAQRSLQRQIEEIRKKQRLPGAAMRDQARLRIRSWRDKRA
ncbi:hypothetical protein GCM10022199_07420 [Marihabitans asiaticum]|uniref:polysaccharide pyruvyl transferase family protein n=1 Tax=Marihabitans asiaticum TaxID=415218 RepID=UPI00119CBD1F|nr:polysaccharide pyruvyl transferase family protein [Marihabitans asiaticum]